MANNFGPFLSRHSHENNPVMNDQKHYSTSLVGAAPKDQDETHGKSV